MVSKKGDMQTLEVEQDNQAHYIFQGSAILNLFISCYLWNILQDSSN